MTCCPNNFNCLRRSTDSSWASTRPKGTENEYDRRRYERIGSEVIGKEWTGEGSIGEEGRLRIRE